MLLHREDSQGCVVSIPMSRGLFVLVALIGSIFLLRYLVFPAEKKKVAFFLVELATYLLRNNKKASSS